MTDLHPNWQSTDASAEEQLLPVHVAERPKQSQEPPAEQAHQPRMRRLSRQPAAIAGMLLAISIGFSLFFGFDQGTETTVRITENGFSPTSVTVTTGGDIRWINETDRPQVLQSDALCTHNQECFSTHSIAPKESATLTITPEFDAGTYSYYSINAQGMEASITVLAAKAGTPTAAVNTATRQNLAQTVPFDSATHSATSSAGAGQSSSLFSRTGNLAFALPPADADGFVDIASVLAGNGDADAAYPAAGARNSVPSGAASSDSRREPDRVVQLPVNPYTVNGNRAHPFDAQGKPITAGGSSSSVKSVKGAKTTLHGGAPLPIAQPATGPALWITIMGAFALLFFVTRNLLKRAYIE
ncbi:MAG: hypothetical protein Q7S29_05475 [Candidatus Peribacter sp.]|nr:hypothetical protein [Candidatus Peribacter sp.]